MWGLQHIPGILPLQSNVIYGRPSNSHPSFVDNAELEGIKGPLSIAAAGKLFSFISTSVSL